MSWEVKGATTTLGGSETVVLSGGGAKVDNVTKKEKIDMQNLRNNMQH